MKSSNPILKCKNFLNFLGCTCLMASSLAAAYAQTEDIKEQKEALASIKKNIVSEKLNLRSAHHQQNIITRQLKKDDEQVSILAKKMRSQKSNQIKLKKETQSLYRDISELEVNKKKHQKQLEQHLKFAFIQKQNPAFANLFNGSPQDAERLSVYYTYINKARAEKVKALQETATHLKAKYNKLKEKQQQAQALHREYLRSSKKLEEQQKQRKNTLLTLQNHIKEHQDQLEFLQVEEAQVHQILDESQRSEKMKNLLGLKSLKGKRPWPTRGKLTARFGTKRGGQVYWKGLMLKAPEGQEIHSVAAGQVIFSDWVKGLGMLTIINHGDGFMTLYGHAQTLLTKVGDYIPKGETIALVGSSGGLEAPHLYFEVRYRGKALNPERYLSKKRKR